MSGGYMGKILDVNLTTGKVEEELLGEGLCRDYIGGYGMAARLLYDRIPVGANPLGPNNILGLLTGPLTGTPAVIGSRFVQVPIVDAHLDSAIFLGHWHNICKPFRVKDDI